jgi:hypothetical protein
MTPRRLDPHVQQRGHLIGVCERHARRGAAGQREALVVGPHLSIVSSNHDPVAGRWSKLTSAAARPARFLT